MTALQQQLFELLKSECDDTLTESALIADIQAMNAAELRHNIKVFEETSP